MYIQGQVDAVGIRRRGRPCPTRPRPRPPGSRYRPGAVRSVPPHDLLQERRDTRLERFGPPWPIASRSRASPNCSPAEVHRLGDAIGVEVQAVPRPEADRPLLVGVVGQADRGPPALQDHRIGAGGQVHRAGVPGGDVAELPGRGVQDPVDHRGELLGRRVEREEPVQPGGDLGGRRDVRACPDVAVPDQDRGRLRGRREEAAQRHRQQGRRDAVAADVQDVKPDLAVAERDDVQAVAGQLVAGPVDPGEVRARDARRPRGAGTSPGSSPPPSGRGTSGRWPSPAARWSPPARSAGGGASGASRRGRAILPSGTAW